MDWLDEIAATWDAEDADAGGIFSLVGDAAGTIFGDSTGEGSGATGALASAIGGDSGTGSSVVKTGSDSDWSIGKMLTKAWDGIKWEDPKVQASAFKIGSGVVAGLGAGYMGNKKLEQEKELAQQRMDIERQLANTQAAKMANQNFSSMTFNKPGKGLIYSPATVEPVSKWGQA